VALIADPRHWFCPIIRSADEEQPRRFSNPVQRLTRSHCRESPKRSRSSASRLRLSRHLTLASARARHRQGRARGGAKEFATPRKTEIVEAEIEVEDEDLIEREDVAVTVTHAGYIKRTPLADYRVQGGAGRGAPVWRRARKISSPISSSPTRTRRCCFFFDRHGLPHEVWRLPEARIQGRGKRWWNLLPLQEGERITTILPLPEREHLGKMQLLFATKSAMCAGTSFPTSPISTRPARSR